ncbi:Reverse transcriptase domain-containing protein [Aphis craccivora]|uniref:Reverse transcriptase domain-containing protein n=1 Tax=Aphis craccivora TaxID=307492 RepID=A0A6G0ZC38_APHCR|nr:Reverse transcriptase domain-containing protein [Aphis craccivora]
MPNVGGPAQCKRSLLMSVVHSRLLYGAAVWADEVQKVAKYQNIMLQSQRCAAVRVARCYRLVSDMAALVLARMPPVTVQAAVLKRAAALKNEGVILSAKLKEDDTLSRWQAMWDASKKAEWTKFLIPNLRRWWTHGSRQVSYHMAQALTGHGCFQAYLWRKNRATNPGCVHCPNVFDDAEHTLFNCPFWDAARADVAAAIRKSVGPEDVQYLLCGPVLQELPEEPSTRRMVMAASVRHKELFMRMVETIFARKEELVRQRQRQL